MWRKVSIDADVEPDEQTTEYDTFKRILAEIAPFKTEQPSMFPRPKPNVEIPSYGIIAVYDAGNAFEYFCTQMRTTFEFSEYVRCGPRLENLFEYLCSMTVLERKLLLTQDFDRLWDDLMLEEKSLFPETKKAVRQLHEEIAPYLHQLIAATSSNVYEPPWVFPKGRMKKCDRTLLSAALREMKEEGNVEFGQVVLMYEKQVVVVHSGTDGCTYSTTYYVVKAERRYEPLPTTLEANCLGELCLSHDMQNYTWLSIAKDVDVRTVKTCLDDRLERALLRVHSEISAKSM